MSPIFIACRKFDPHCGEAWSSYIAWSGLQQVTELVSLDNILCPLIIQELIEEDWEYNVHANNRVYFFRDYQYLKRRIAYDASQHNLLGIFERPTQTPAAMDAFTFCGYEIWDSHESISVLTNCGAFPDVYSPAELNQFGLLTDLAHANRIAETIRNTHWADDHCRDCHVWGVARYTGC